MNLFEILLALRGYDSQKRRRFLTEWAVDPILCSHIQNCFDDDGHVIWSTEFEDEDAPTVV